MSPIEFFYHGVSINTAAPLMNFDNIGIVPIDIAIDIKPGSDPNSINLGSEGVIPVAILTTRVADGDLADFDASDVDPSSLSLEAAAARTNGNSSNIGSLEDVDGDGDLRSRRALPNG